MWNPSGLLIYIECELYTYQVLYFRHVLFRTNSHFKNAVNSLILSISHKFNIDLFVLLLDQVITCNFTHRKMEGNSYLNFFNFDT
jgi:hypothetical protein